MKGTSNRNSSKHSRRTFPKEGEKKKNELIKKLKDRVKYLEKKSKFYEDELCKYVENPENLTSPRQKTVIQKPEDRMSLDEFRRDFSKKFKESLKERINARNT